MFSERKWVLDLEPLPTSIPVARHAVTDWVSSVGAESLADIATLLVSELASNAVIHVGRPFTIAAVWRPPTLHVDVVDLNPATPIAIRAEQPGPGGRGLRIVDRLADAWGVSAFNDRKTVWFDLQLADRP